MFDSGALLMLCSGQDSVRQWMPRQRHATTVFSLWNHENEEAKPYFPTIVFSTLSSIVYMSSKGSSQSPPWWWWWCCRQQQPGSVLEGTTGHLASSSLQTPWIGTRHRRWGNIRHVSNVWQINPLHWSVLLGSWRVSGRVEIRHDPSSTDIWRG